MGGAVAGRELHEAQLVAHEAQAQRLGVDGDDRAEVEVGGQVAVMQGDGHGSGLRIGN